jgi:hypothetical protein
LIILQKQHYKSNWPYLASLVNYLRFSLHGAKPFIEEELPFKNPPLLLLVLPASFLLFTLDLLRILTRKAKEKFQ